METLDWLRGWVDRQPIPGLLQWATALVALGVGLAVARASRGLVVRAARDRFDEQQTMIAQRVLYWTVVVLALATALRQVGFDLSVVMGAAGVLTVAIGFASQTSASNLISGLFLLGERPFVVGDTIQVGATLGQVVAIDLLSVKLRTFDNRLVRVPNESLLKSEIVNLTHYAIRRIDVSFRVGFETDVAVARAALLRAADFVPFVLDEPRPSVVFERYEDFGVRLQFSAWCTKETVQDARDALAEAVRVTLEREGIGMQANVSAVTKEALQTL
jgi:small-conductance mechanosensitive channel